MNANSAVDAELRAEAYDDLNARVDDWKNHRVDHFGELLLHGHFPVVTGKSDVQKEVRALFSRNNSPQDIATTSAMKNLSDSLEAKCKALVSKPKTQWDLQTALDHHEFFDGEGRAIDDGDLDEFLSNMVFHYFSGLHPVNHTPFLAQQYADSLGLSRPDFEQYTIYLFERILLCCKEVNPNKSKDKLMGTQKDKKDKKDKNRNREPNKNAKLQLKGRIFMTNVTDVMSSAKQGIIHDFIIY